MKYIAHRGNLYGPNPSTENSPGQIDNCLSLGFDCEIDIWGNEHDELFLGHDAPQYPTSIEYLLLRADKLWCHCKNSYALSVLNKVLPESNPLNYFFHNTDDYTLTSKGYVWVYPGKPMLHGSICVMPEHIPDLNSQSGIKFGGVCSDYIAMITSSE